MLYPTLRKGKCPECKTIYRWEDTKGQIKLSDTECRDCEVQLKATSPQNLTHVVDVEAEWVRRLSHEVSVD